MTIKTLTTRRCPHCKTRLDIGMLLGDRAQCRCQGWYALVWRPSLGRAGLVKRPAPGGG